jgi:hypothetical protein
LTATATVTLVPLVGSAATGAAAPANQVPGVATGVVSGSFFNVTPGSEIATLTVEQYLANPVGGTLDGTFFDVNSPDAGPTDRVVLFVNDPTGSGTLLYFNGADWQEVRSSGGVQPLRLPDGRLMVVLDATSFPRITGLFGTVFTIPVASSPSATGLVAPVSVTTTTTISTPVASTSSGTQGSTTDVNFRSNVELSIALTSTQSNLIQASESTLSSRLNDSSASGSPGAGGSGASASRSGTTSGNADDPQAAEDICLDLLWIGELSPETFEELMRRHAAGVKLDGKAIAAVIPLPVQLGPEFGGVERVPLDSKLDGTNENETQDPEKESIEDSVIMAGDDDQRSTAPVSPSACLLSAWAAFWVGSAAGRARRRKRA